jgi:hypothetical protein
MRTSKIQAVELVRRIRDRQAKRLAGKKPEEIVGFYRAAGEAAMGDAQQRAKAREPRAG